MSIPRPINRQFGSKARVAAAIVALIPPHVDIWVEVFAGTASVTLAKEPHPSEHLNDLNGDIVNLFRVLRDEAARARLCELVELTPRHQDEWNDCRADRRNDDPVEDVRRYLVRSWMGVNGDVPRSTGFKFDRTASKQCADIWARLPRRINHVAQRLKHCHIHQRPAIEMLRRFGIGEGKTLLFIDPPYPWRNRASKYEPQYQVEMSDDEHAELAKAVREVKASVMLTMAAGTVYDEVLADWHRVPIAVRGLANAVNIETVFLNYPPPGRLQLEAPGAA